MLLEVKDLGKPELNWSFPSTTYHCLAPRNPSAPVWKSCSLSGRGDLRDQHSTLLTDGDTKAQKYATGIYFFAFPVYSSPSSRNSALASLGETSSPSHRDVIWVWVTPPLIPGVGMWHWPAKQYSISLALLIGLGIYIWPTFDSKSRCDFFCINRWKRWTPFLLDM